MNNRYKYVKIGLSICIACSILLCIAFFRLNSMRIAESEEVTGQEEEIEEIINSQEKEKALPSDRPDSMMTEISDSLQDYERTLNDISEAEKKYDNLLKRYNIKLYVDSAAVSPKMDGAGKAYVERYFRIEKDELQEIIGEVTELDAGLPGQDDFGTLLPVGDKIWVRYGEADDYPIGLVVQNPLIDIGYMDARVGRAETLNDIQRRYAYSELEFIQYDWGYVHYLRYEDADFVYYYADTSVFQEPTILYVEPKKEIEAGKKDKPQERHPDTLTGTEANANPDTYEDTEAKADSETDREQYGVLYDSVKSDIEALAEESARELSEIEDKTKILQVKYDLFELLEDKSNEDENPAVTFGKYFQLEQGELARIEGVEDVSIYDKFGLLNSHFTGPVIWIDDSMSVQYNNEYYVLEDILPTAVIITDSGIDLGYMDARAGMDFEEIQQNAYEKDIEEGFMYSWEMPVYYIQYRDEYYEYTFISDDSNGQDSWLIVR